jgi:hypothetical protein
LIYPIILSFSSDYREYRNLGGVQEEGRPLPCPHLLSDTPYIRFTAYASFRTGFIKIIQKPHERISTRPKNYGFIT